MKKDGCGMALKLEQIPSAGSRQMYYCGDELRIELRVSGHEAGTAYVRTNLGCADVHLGRIVGEVEHTQQRLGNEWRDVAMHSEGAGLYSCRLPLHEVGTFEAKCVFQDRSGKFHWVDGENAHVRVEPSCSVNGNTIYNAFVRQFGKSKYHQSRSEDMVRAEQYLDGHEYTVVPPSGRFRDFLKEVPFVCDVLGFRIVQLLPVQPPPVTFARMGRYGSPFAPVDYFGVDSSMADFDRRTTPLEQFRELVDGIHAHGGLVLLDLPIDHTGWASTMQNHHPEWFERDENGHFRNPGAWGVVWEDLCRLDFSDTSLWRYLAKVFLHWVSMGVDGFRCDAGYMIPRDVWRYIISKVRRQYPDTLFFLEGLGGAVEVTRDLLERGGMNWAYTELFQVYGASSVRGYLSYLCDNGSNYGLGVNFAETHDNSRLASVSPRWAEMRVTLAALSAPCGAFGIANGVEWLATEKIDVHGASALNWGSEQNLVDYISKLNRILRCHPAFGKRGTMYVAGHGSGVGLVRGSCDGSSRVLVIFNVEEHDGAYLEWKDGDYAVTDVTLDLLTGRRPALSRIRGGWRLDLAPGESVCLSEHDLGWWENRDADVLSLQRMREQIMKALVYCRGYIDMGDCDMDGLLACLRKGGCSLLREIVGGESGYLPVLEWRVERDEHRRVPLAAGHFIQVRMGHRFKASLYLGDRRVESVLSYPVDGGMEQVLLRPLEVPENWFGDAELRIESYVGGAVERHTGAFLLLPGSSSLNVPLCVERGQLQDCVLGFCANELGGYAMVRGKWGTLRSKYDAMLAGNLSQDCPVDRRIGLVRCRGWVVYRDYSIELNATCESSFQSGYGNQMQWRFSVPAGFGRLVDLEATLQLSRTSNSGSLSFKRCVSHAGGSYLEDNERVRLILRPDVDWRVNHEVTKAFAGAESEFGRCVRGDAQGFSFAPWGGEGLWMHCEGGAFSVDGAWTYSVGLSEDAERCLPSETDLYSPGYFSFELPGGGTCGMTFGLGQEVPQTLSFGDKESLPGQLELGECLRRSLNQYLARRDTNKTVIAGYPWFLDWGRDTLICLRGLVSAGEYDACRDIVRAFAGFEDKGTIPNMIRGKDSGDRATSDAPLWLFVAVEELLAATGDKGLLSMECAGRSLLVILESIAWHYRHGVPNGVCCDSSSGLIYSPSHYTWMDTNYPAGTPRAGYPVEIQALWIHALRFMERVTGRQSYGQWYRQAVGSFVELFVRPDGRGLRDCLHGDASQGARGCGGDDAIRPNQLLAVTLCDFLDDAVVESILRECSGLMIPGGIRSLSDEVVSYALPVYRDGQLLNEPLSPYRGRYAGDEDTCRKVAYHNGTAWGWQMPLYSEALYRHWGESARKTAYSLLTTVALPMSSRCLGHIPEIYDGDLPHTGRGCPAQAWSMSESYRVWRLLQRE